MIFSIKTREQALKSIHYSGIACIGVAVFQIVASTFFFTALLEWVLLALLGVFLLLTKSRVIAIALLLHSVYLIAPIFFNIASFPNAGAEIFIGILLVFTSAKAIEATFKLQHIIKNQK